ncbi:MAG TPA: Holliday junction resolvase RuvX [Terriglobia bacterium]|nr:Holliday junction resolvase RuvX [Terriglobia bacterium]
MAHRVLAIDFGMRRLGLAVSDTLGVIAQGLQTIERPNAGAGFSEIVDLVDQYEIREILIGNPLSKQGRATEMSRRVAKFADKLRRHVKCEVKLWDERLSSAEASRLLRSSGISLEKRRRAVDRVTATLFLQSYLDWRAYEQAHSGPEGQ